MEIPVEFIADNKRVSLLLVVKGHGYLLVTECELVDRRLFLTTIH